MSASRTQKAPQRYRKGVGTQKKMPRISRD